MTTVPAVMSALIRACSPTVKLPAEEIVPVTSPSTNSSLRKVRSPVIETPLERTAPTRELVPPLAGAGENEEAGRAAGGGGFVTGAAGGVEDCGGFAFLSNIKVQIRRQNNFASGFFRRHSKLFNVRARLASQLRDLLV